jgi:two-component system sensor histidine kinase CreC
MRRSLEEVLVDTANLLAVTVEREVLEGRIADGDFARHVDAFGRRRLNAMIYETKKTDPSMIVYVTDREGRVIYDSRGRDLGADYSRWNDVYRTLRGEYGARATREQPDDARSTVMYVAAPVLSRGEIVGVLTVGKPAVVVMPFVDAARRSLWTKSAVLLGLSIMVALALAFGLTRSVRKLTRYADALKAERRAPPPRVGPRELTRLAEAMESMSEELAGKKHVEQYLHALTHELKSPLTAIEGAAELLDEELPEDARRRFLGNIRAESARLKRVVERLLRLSALEGRRGLEDVALCDTRALLNEVAAERLVRTQAKNLKIDITGEAPSVEAEPFLLRQALGNLLDNAIDFSSQGASIELDARASNGAWVVTVRDHGPGFPIYAEQRLFERFYSLPRPDGSPKSTGLGLTAVREVAELHGGAVRLENHAAGGAVATLEIPLLQRG